MKEFVEKSFHQLKKKFLKQIPRTVSGGTQEIILKGFSKGIPNGSIEEFMNKSLKEFKENFHDEF